MAELAADKMVDQYLWNALTVLVNALVALFEPVGIPGYLVRVSGHVFSC
jgi:hypothetical protein